MKQLIIHTKFTDLVVGVWFSIIVPLGVVSGTCATAVVEFTMLEVGPVVAVMMG